MNQAMSIMRTSFIFIFLIFTTNIFAQDIDLAGESPENEFDYIADSSFKGEEGREGDATSLKRVSFRFSYGLNATSGGNRSNEKTSYFGTELNNSYDIGLVYHINPRHYFTLSYQQDVIDYFLNTTSFVTTEDQRKEYVGFSYSALFYRFEFKIGYAKGNEWAFLNVKNIIADKEKIDMDSYYIGVGSYFPVLMGVIAKASFQYHILNYESNSFEGDSGSKKVFELDFHYRGFNAFGVRFVEEIITYDATGGQRIFTTRIMPYVRF
jgi:hypothetical protein